MMATYGGTKAFVTSFTQALHEEAKGTGVHVCVQCPGYTATEFGERAGVEATNIPKFMWQTADEVAVSGLTDLRKGAVVSVPGWKLAMISTWPSESEVDSKLRMPLAPLSSSSISRVTLL